MSNKPNIPSWQRASAESSVAKPLEAEQPQTAEQPEDSTTPIAVAPTPTEDDVDEPESTSLLDQARRFLEDSTIRDAPREKKVAFLESKGVNAEDIERLLGDNAQRQDASEVEEVGERAWSTVSTDVPSGMLIRFLSSRSSHGIKLTLLDATKTRSSIATHATATRYPTDRYLSRISSPDREPTTFDHHSAPGEHSICRGRAYGHNLRLVKIHCRANDTESRRRPP